MMRRQENRRKQHEINKIRGGVQPLYHQKGGKALILVSVTSMEGGQRRKGGDSRG